MMKVVEDRIRRIAAEHARIVVAFSGGKDSWFLTQCVLTAGIDPKRVTVVHVDTGVEIPWVKEVVEGMLGQIEKAGAQVEVVRPERGFFWYILEQRYPPPSHRFRWCQNHLKVRPMREFLKEFAKESENPALLLGLRFGESAERDRTLKKYLKDTEKCSYAKKNVITTYVPIVDVEESVVIANMPAELKEVYDMLAGKKKRRSARMGCWCCTLVRNPLGGYVHIYEKARKMYEFVEWLRKEARKKENRAPYYRDGRPAKNGMGCLSKEFCSAIREKLESLGLDEFQENYLLQLQTNQ